MIKSKSLSNVFWIALTFLYLLLGSILLSLWINKEIRPVQSQIDDDWDQLKKLQDKQQDQIHNFLPNGGMMLGCDFSKSEAVKQVKDAERLAILTGDSLKNNMRHALSVIVNNKLSIFDIGEITEDDLLVA